jgi:hypothetical protein
VPILPPRRLHRSVVAFPAVPTSTVAAVKWKSCGLVCAQVPMHLRVVSRHRGS